MPGTAQADAPRPNLLFIVTDHQRADSIGMTQAGVEVTPNLNGLARRSVNFTRAYNASPICAPARTALATGKYPTANGIVFNDWRGTCAGDHKPVHQCLADAGYSVAHIGIDHIKVRPAIRERVEFSEWVSNREHTEHLQANGIPTEWPGGADVYRRAITENHAGERAAVKYSNTHAATWPHAAEHFKDSYWCDRAVDFLGRAGDEPFALFLYLWAPHPPLVVPEPYASLFDPAELDLPENVDVPAEGEPSNRRAGIAAQLAEGVSTDEWRRVWAAHLGLVNLADAGIGRALDALAASSHADDTAVFFMSDHGDHLGQHRMYQKMEMYEQAVRVPMILNVPGGATAEIDAPVSHLDIMPTILDLMAIDAPDDLDGISLLSCLRTGEAPPDRPQYSGYSGNPTVGDIRRAVITRSHKYIHDPDDIPELYDLEADPLETRNIAADPGSREVVRELHALGKSWAESHNDQVRW
ncbi:sulfatase-like hydrolase/transferase [Candidatus Poribacteria bacterium]|nr:sulfatase-like hydrolase/transferase [Candidatus Poribacteria bacterium]MBT5532546.1 sulfatase-like hydrolase/transferase [Candidatus Poribacteria bacterium]MBT5713023.1 sulfatase-like hydrolase/transferase [Candidatus Poribacteria bacterium]MBT7098347.1 sulfatase-like hydrolase/transferase [Candidatus Poribacteria bacterium]MBT7808525.1 sulfatase-like hydrolase/transferase [Candidatus Poribacteria bacterium]